MTSLGRVVKKSVAFSIPQFASRFLSVALLPVYTRFLSPADYGVLELLDITLYFFSAIFGVQLSNAIYYHVTRANSEDRPHVFSTALLGSAFTGAAAALVGALLANSFSRAIFGSGAYTFPLQLYFAAFAFTPLTEAGLAVLRARDQDVRWNQMSVARAFFQASLNVVFLVFFRLGYLSIVWSSLLTSAVFGCGLALLFFRHNRICFRWSVFTSILRYSLPLGIGTIAILLVHYGDRFFLKHYVSLADIGVYALAYKIGMLSSFVHGPFTVYWSVERFRIARDAEGDAFYVRVFSYLVLVLAIAGVAIAVLSPPALAFLVPVSYQGASALIPWIAFAYVFRSIGDHLRSALYVEARTVADTRVMLTGSAICLVGYATLIPRFGSAGAVAATLGAFLVMMVHSFVASQRVRHYRFEYRRLRAVTLAAALSCIPLPLLLGRGALLQAGAGAAILGLFFLVALLAGFFTRKELDSVREGLRRLPVLYRDRA